MQYFILKNFLFRYPNHANWDNLERFAGKVKQGSFSAEFTRFIKSSQEEEVLNSEPAALCVEIKNNDIRAVFDSLKTVEKDRLTNGINLFVVNVEEVRYL